MALHSAANSKASRPLLLIEAVLPIAGAQAYIWSVPHARPRWLDLLFGLVLAAVIVVLVVRRGLRVPAAPEAHVPLGWRTFGLARGPDHRRCALPLLVFTLVAVTALLLWGWQSGRLRRDSDLGRALIAYPLWGLLQQAVMFGVAYPRLRLVCGAGAAPYVTALLFAVGHSPNPLLMGGGAIMVLVFAFVWQRAPSLPLLALSHGIIGAVCDKALDVSMRVGLHYFQP